MVMSYIVYTTSVCSDKKNIQLLAMIPALQYLYQLSGYIYLYMKPLVRVAQNWYNLLSSEMVCKPLINSYSIQAIARAGMSVWKLSSKLFIIIRMIFLNLYSLHFSSHSDIIIFILLWNH